MDLGAQEASGRAHPPGEAGRDLLKEWKEEEDPGVRETPTRHIPFFLPKELYSLELQQEEWEVACGWGFPMGWAVVTTLRIGERPEMATVVVMELGVYVEGLSGARTTVFSPILPSALRGPCLKRGPTNHQEEGSGLACCPGGAWGRQGLESAC